MLAWRVCSSLRVAQRCVAYRADLGRSIPAAPRYGRAARIACYERHDAPCSRCAQRALRDVTKGHRGWGVVRVGQAAEGLLGGGVEEASADSDGERSQVPTS